MDSKIATQSTDAQSLDTAFDLLSNRRRRAVVVALSERDPPIGLRDLAADVVSIRTGTDPEALSPETTRDLVTTLHHSHLPKLDDAGYLEYDVETNLVESVQIDGLAPLATGSLNG